MLFNFLKLKFENPEISFEEKLLNVDSIIKSINELKLITKDSIVMSNYPFNIYLYYSVWYDPFLSEITHFLSYNKLIYSIKVRAMLEHLSQLKNNHMGYDSTPFYVRATIRDENYFKKINENNKIEFKNQDNSNNEDCYCEVFHKV